MYNKIVQGFDNEDLDKYKSDNLTIYPFIHSPMFVEVLKYVSTWIWVRAGQSLRRGL